MLRHKSTGLGKKSPKAYCPNWRSRVKWKWLCCMWNRLV
jgi:hypothetical protein